MTDPIQKPPRKDPQVRTQVPTPPPFLRSRKAFEFSAHAAEGRFVVQRCGECGALGYPAREACHKCLSVDLIWQECDPGGQLIAVSTIQTSTNTYFRERMPWNVGTVALDNGVSVMVHVHGDLQRMDRVRVIARTDGSAQGALMALPEKETNNMADDKQFRTLSCDPKHRRVLITDCRTELGQVMAQALLEAEAGTVFAGIAEDWRPYKGRDELLAHGNVELMALDLTDTASVAELAGEIGGKVDILINTAEHFRPGGATDQSDVVSARDAMEVNYFGPLRLMQHFGGAMKSRAADGVNSACAWVNILSVNALANTPEFGTTHASQAAALSLSQSFRAEVVGSGLKVINVLSGPLEEAWRQQLPPPKVSPQVLARAVVQALQQGIEEVTVGAVAEDIVKRWRNDPAALAREFLQGEV